MATLHWARLDELLEQKSDIADAMLEKLRTEQDRLFVEFKEAGIKDIILPGGIRTIMNTVLVAEKTAQANVMSAGRRPRLRAAC